MMKISTFAAILVIFFATLVENTVQWGTRQAHFRAVETEDVSNERVSIEKVSSASELSCSQKCLWHEECFFKKYDRDARSCELLQKINRVDFDSDALLSKKETPIKKQASSCSLKDGEIVSAVIADVIRTCGNKGTYKSCTEALSANCFHHAVYHICLTSYKTPLLIECKLHQNNESVAVFHYNGKYPTLVEGYDSPGSYRRVFNYSTPLESMIAVINQSRKCKQFTKAECFDATMAKGDSDYTWLSGRYGKKLAYWGGGPSDGKGCSCGIHDNCANGDKKCNCDSNDQVWRKDKGFITKKDVLPITAINVGDTGSMGNRKEQFKYTVGSLICFF